MIHDFFDGLEWAKKESVDVESIVIFLNGETYIIFYVIIGFDRVYNIKYVGNHSMDELARYQNTHNIYKSDSPRILQYEKELLKTAYRKEKIFKLLKI